MFSPERQLREIIVEEIRKEPLSISGLVRKLKTRGVSIHRLVLTGYLRALTDSGVIREKAVPPSKIYVPVGSREMNIYDAISNACEEHSLDQKTGTLAAVYTLQFLFHRPVFRMELQEMRMSAIQELKSAPPSLVSESRRILMRSGYRIPESEPAYMVEGNYDRELKLILASAVAQGFRLSHLSLDTHQLTL
ncbi:MAG: hypothetical protein QXP70_00985 [Methanomassiliicoccales archaeon]